MSHKRKGILLLAAFWNWRFYWQFYIYLVLCIIWASPVNSDATQLHKASCFSFIDMLLIPISNNEWYYVKCFALCSVAQLGSCILQTCYTARNVQPNTNLYKCCILLIFIALLSRSSNKGACKWGTLSSHWTHSTGDLGGSGWLCEMLSVRHTHTCTHNLQTWFTDKTIEHKQLW